MKKEEVRYNYKVKEEEMLRNYWSLLVKDELEEDEYVAVFFKEGNKCYYVKTCIELMELIRKYKRNSNIFINLSTVKGKGRKEGNMYKRNAIAIDFDKKDFEDLNDLKDFINHIKNTMPELYYHAIVDSGNGYHFYYTIQTTKDTKRVTELTKKISTILKSDKSVAISTQMMRIPTTLNQKGKPKPVKVIHNVEGAKYYKRYYVSQLEDLANKVIVNCEVKNKCIEENKPIIRKKYREFLCCENMLEQGAMKGERNFCLGRLTSYYRDIMGYTKNAAIDTILDWNQLCSPIKDEKEVEDDFNRYWENTSYNLLGCEIDDDRKIKILRKYSDCGNCQLKYREFVGDTEEYVLIHKKIVEDKLIKKFGGYHYLLILLLTDNVNGLTYKILKGLLTNNGRVCIGDGTLKKILLDLELNRLIESKAIHNEMIYKIKESKNFADGYVAYPMKIVYKAISKEITQRDLMVYILLRRNCRTGQNSTQITMGELLQTHQTHVSESIRNIEKANLIRIEKRPTDRGLSYNRYSFV